MKLEPSGLSGDGYIPIALAYQGHLVKKLLPPRKFHTFVIFKAQTKELHASTD